MTPLTNYVVSRWVNKALEHEQDLGNNEIQYPWARPRQQQNTIPVICSETTSTCRLDFHSLQQHGNRRGKANNDEWLAVVLDGIQLGFQKLHPLDPFDDIFLMSNKVTTFSETNRFDLDLVELESYKKVA